MSELELDVIVVADLRLGRARNRGVAATLQALAEAGYRVGLVRMLCADIANAAAGQARLEDPTLASTMIIDAAMTARCRLLVADSVLPFIQPPATPLAAVAARRVIRCDQPLVDLTERALFDPKALLANAARVLGGPVQLAPIDATVAGHLARFVASECRTDAWPQIVAASRYRRSAGEAPIRLLLVGDGWRDASAGADRERLNAAGITFIPSDDVADADLPLEVGAALARPPDGLPGLLEAEVAEATASGLPILGPSSYGPALAGQLVPVDTADASEIPWSVALACPSPAPPPEASTTALLERVRGLIGEPRETAPRILLRRDLRPGGGVAFMSSNGIGIGHLVRGMAIARRLPIDITPVFFTLSAAGHLAEQEGWHVEGFQHARTFGGDMREWRRALASRLGDFLSFHRPRVLVFDGNVPYRALQDVRRRFPEVWFVWVRRGMWRPEHRHPTRLDGTFDLVLEPRELASAFDRGATAECEDAVRTEPVTYLDASEFLSRAEARELLGVGNGVRAILLQLGSGNNYDMASVRTAVVAAFASRPDTALYEVRWPISFTDAPHPSIHRIERFPLADVLPAFDAAVTACGYNGFHEVLQARVPAVFVPNQNPEMDAQDARAEWAATFGFGRSVLASDPDRVVSALGELLDGEAGAAARSALATLRFDNGAWAMAGHVAELTSGIRTPEPPTRRGRGP